MYLYSWSRNCDITQIIFDVWTRWPSWKMNFFHCWDTFWEWYKSNIFVLYKISQNKINEPNIPHFIIKSYLGLSMAIWKKHFWHSNDGHFDLVKKSSTNVAEMCFNSRKFKWGYSISQIYICFWHNHFSIFPKKIFFFLNVGNSIKR